MKFTKKACIGGRKPLEEDKCIFSFLLSFCHFSLPLCIPTTRFRTDQASAGLFRGGDGQINPASLVQGNNENKTHKKTLPFSPFSPHDSLDGLCHIPVPDDTLVGSGKLGLPGAVGALDGDHRALLSRQLASMAFGEMSPSQGLQHPQCGHTYI